MTCFNVTCSKCGKPMEIDDPGGFQDGVFASFARSMAEHIICDACKEELDKAEREKKEAEWRAMLPELYFKAGIPTAFTLMPNAPRQYAARTIWNHREENMLITGDTGTGKTTSACRVLMRMVENGWKVKYMTFARFLDEIRNCKMRRPDESGDISQVELYYDRLRQYKALCLDEIVGKTQSGENVMQTLYELIDMAYSGMICPLWLIGNVRERSLEMLFGDETGSVMRRLQSLRFRQIGLTKEGVMEQ